MRRFLFRGGEQGEEAVVNDDHLDQVLAMDDHSESASNHDVVDAEDLLNVFAVFPDIEAEYALQLLDEEDNDVNQVLDRLFDMEGNYPKDDIPPPPPPPTEDATETTDEGDGTKTIKFDFMSPSSFVPSTAYKLQSMDQLLFQFPFLEWSKVKSLFKASGKKYAITHNTICQTILSKADTPMELNSDRKFDELLLAVLFEKASLEKYEIDLLSDLFKPDFKRSIHFSLAMFIRKRKITCPILQEELQYVHEKTLELKSHLEKRIAKRGARQASILAGTAMECSCCYEEVAMEELVACRDEGHLFCEDCLSTYVENQIFGQGGMGVDPETKEAATEIKCCHGDGCSSGFDRLFLEQSLKESVLKKYDELSYQMTIEQAGLKDNMYSCGKCDILCELPENANFFVCPIEGCNFEACRHCGEPPHIGRLCTEVEASETKGRTRVEEAVTAAILRRCPSCHKAVMKSDGCNKMTCSCFARQKWCYVCTEKISGYEHFCDKPHCNHRDPPTTCNGCPLYTDAETDDLLRAREAALAEKAKVESEAVPEVQRKWGGPKRPRNRGNVVVDIESILRIPGTDR